MPTSKRMLMINVLMRKRVLPGRYAGRSGGGMFMKHKSLSDGSAGRLTLLGEAYFGSISSVCYSAKGVLDWQFINDARIIFVEPLLKLSVIRVIRIGNGFKH